MADTSLDDFFAKKDKSKKAKKKFTTSEQIAKKLEESGKKSTEMASKKEKDKPIQQTPASTITQIAEQASSINIKGDDEWKDFEEEKEKDYSGLKIHNFQISEPKDDDFERDRNMEDEDGEPVKPRESHSGPWNKISAQASANVLSPSPPPPLEVVSPVSVEDKKEDSRTPGGVYRPPHARGSSGGGSGPSSGPRSKAGMKTAPEISSELHFPSLSATADGAKGSKKGGDRTPDSERGFESVKRGSRTSEEVVCRGPKLDLGNKYNALSQGDMS